MSHQIALREAASGDIPVLVVHRRLMFEDMAAAGSQHHQPAGLEAMDKAYAECLQIHLANGTVQAWVAEAGDRITASGAISILVWPPGPGRTSGRTALLHSTYTVPECRRRGIARGIVEKAIAFCRKNGCKRTIPAGTGSEVGQSLHAVRFDTTRPP